MLIKICSSFGRLLVILALMIHPAFADEANKPTIFVEEYASTDIRPSFSTILSEEVNSLAQEKKPYGYILDILQKQLNAIPAKNQAQADYHVVFITINSSYETEWRGKKLELPNLDPTLPKNKYESDSNVKSYHFKSTWIRGTLYTKDNKPIGGIIIIPISDIAKKDQLYKAAYGSWDKFDEIDTTKLNDVALAYVYAQKNNTLPEKRLEYYNNTPEGREEKLKGISSSKGRVALVLARFAAICPSKDGQIYSAERIWGKCVKDSQVFYNSLYMNIVSSLFNQVIKASDNKIYDISPSAEVIKAISISSENYNCFSKYIKENAK